MKNLRIKLIVMSLVVMVGLVFSAGAFAAETPKYTKYAEELKQLGLFNGSNKGFELERTPTRVEAAAMLVKLLGKEAEAKAKNYSHPFTDVPSWANHIIGYMYQNKMTTGIGNNKFGSLQLISARDFTVFVVKSLGYTTSDFEYAKTMDFAKSINLISDIEYGALSVGTFIRDEMVLLSKNALSTKMKGSADRLIDVLVNNKVVSINAANSLGYYNYPMVPLIITGDATSGYKFEYQYTQITGGVYDTLMFSLILGTSEPNNLKTIEELAMRLTISKENYDYYVSEYNKDGFFAPAPGTYYPSMNGYQYAYNKSGDLAYYFENPTYLKAGKFYITLVPASDALKIRVRELREEMTAYIAKHAPSIVKLDSSMYTFTKEGVLQVHREKLPAELKDFYAIGIGANSNSVVDPNWLLEQEFRRIPGNLQPNGLNIGDKANFGNRGNMVFEIFDKNMKLLGYGEFFAEY